MKNQISCVTNEISPLHGLSIQDRQEFDADWPEPRRVMFIYFRVNTNQTLVVDQYMYDMAVGEKIDDVENRLIENARPSPRDNPNKKDPPCIANRFDRVSFGWEPCYVSMFLDEELWKFHPWPLNKYEETVVFRKNKLLYDKKTEQPFIKNFNENKSFFNFERLEIKKRQLIRFVNFLRDKDDKKIIPPDPKSDPIQWPIWEYCMDIYLCMPYYCSADKHFCQWLTLVFDPPQDNGGTGGPPPKSQ